MKHRVVDFPSGDHPGQLRKSQREKDQAMDSQEQVFRGELAGPGSTLLALAKPFDAGLVGGKAAGMLKDFSLGIVQRLPLEHPYPLPIPAGRGEPLLEISGGIGHQCLLHFLAFGNFFEQGSAEEAGFVAVIVVKHPLIDIGAAGDGIHPRTGKSFGGKFREGGFEDAG